MHTKEIPFAGLQGISQQPPTLASDQHVADMLGFFPTPADGLQVAPPYVVDSYLNPAAIPNGQFDDSWLYTQIKPKGAVEDIIVTATGDADDPLLAYTTTGIPVTVQYGADTKAYLTTLTPRASLRTLFVDDALLVSNSEKTVLELATPVIPVEWAGLNAAIITVTLPVTATFYFLLDGTTYSASINASDTPNVAAGSIATALDAATGFTAVSVGNRVELNKDDSTAFVIESFGDASTNTHILNATAKSWADLPNDAGEGTIVRITPDVENTAIKPYWALYLKEGGWREYQDTASTVGFDSTTMPVSLTYSSGSSTLIASTQTYGGRLVGSDVTNKNPYFVNSQIIGLLAYQERVGFVTTSGISWSATDAPTRLYRSSAIETYEDDPIHMRIGGGTTTNEIIDATVFHDIVFVSTTVGKYVISAGREGFSPTAYQVALVSSLKGVSDVSPIMVRDKLYFTTERGATLMLNEYSYDDEEIVVTPEDITAHVPRLIPNTCNVGFGLGNANCIFLTDAENTDESLYVYRFETVDGDSTYSRTTKTQSAWFRLMKPDDCVGLIQIDNGLRFITRTGYTYTFNVNNRLPIRSRKVIECTDLAVAGEWLITHNDALDEDERLVYRVVAEDSAGRFSYNVAFDVLDEETGKLFVDPETYGYDITKLYVVMSDEETSAFVKLLRPYPRDNDGQILSHGVMRLRSVLIDTLNAGQFSIRATVMNRDNPDTPVNVREVTHGEDYAINVQDLTFMEGTVGRSYALAISTASRGMNVTVSPEGIRPLDISTVKYTYRYISRNSRTN